MRRRIPTSRRFIFAGMFFLLLGGFLRVVDSFVLSSEATKVLANLTGPPKDTPEGAVRNAVIETTKPKKTITPPRWLGWSMLSLGVVLTAQGLLLMRRK